MRSKPKLIVVDPSLSLLPQALRAWSREFTVAVVTDARAAAQLMARVQPALVFAGESVDDLRRIAGESAEARIPIVSSYGWRSRELVVRELFSSGLVESLDDRSLAALVRGVTALTKRRETSRALAATGSSVAPSPASPGGSALSSPHVDETDRAAYLAYRLAIA